MSTKKTLYGSLIFILILDAFYFNLTTKLAHRATITSGWGPEYYPTLLSIVLFILCLAGLVQTYKSKSDEKMHIPNFRMILATIGLTFLFILAWVTLGYFYIACFLYLFLLITLYRITLRSVKNVVVNAAVAAGLTFTVYLLFGLAMNIRF